MNWQSSIPSMRILGESHSHVPYHTSHPPFLIPPDTRYDCMTHGQTFFCEMKFLNNLIFSVAEERFLESLQLVESLPPEDSYTYFLAVLKNLGSFYMQFKKFDLTAPLYEKAYDVATKVSECRHQSVFSPACIRFSLIPRPLSHFTHFFLSNSQSNGSFFLFLSRLQYFPEGHSQISSVVENLALLYRRQVFYLLP